MVNHTRNLCSAINPSKGHTAVNTHTHTHIAVELPHNYIFRLLIVSKVVKVRQLLSLVRLGLGMYGHAQDVFYKY